MTIPSTTLAALQHAGQAVYDAQQALVASTREHAQRVSEALEANPFALENDSLYHHWKTLARLSQEVQNIESQLRALYATACAVNEQDAVVVRDLGLPAPAATALAGATPVADAVPPAPRRRARSGRPDAPSTVAKAVQRPPTRHRGTGLASIAPTEPNASTASSAPNTAAADVSGLRGNNAKVMAALRGKLSGRGFQRLRQNELALSAGIPKGSVNLALRQLIALRRIEEGDRGCFRLCD